MIWYEIVGIILLTLGMLIFNALCFFYYIMTDMYRWMEYDDYSTPWHSELGKLEESGK